jgi:magnesium transporter
MTDTPSMEFEAHEELAHLVAKGDGSAIAAFARLLPPEDTPYTISHLDDDDRVRFFALLSEADADLAADLLEHFDDMQAAGMVAELEPQQAAAIVEVMDSDEQADVLAELDEEDLEAILEKLPPEEAADTRQRLEYAEDAAGGLMITEYLSYPQSFTVEQVVDDLRTNNELYNEYEVRYLYVVDADEHLVGVVPMRRLVLSPRGSALSTLSVSDPTTVQVDTLRNELEDLFDRKDYSAVPVLDAQGVLVGIVQRSAVQEARGEQAEEDLAKSRGIIGGEELRTMPTLSRAARRLAFLLPILALTMVSASVIKLFVETVEKLPILAAFLPVVAGLCGSSGGQAVAVSMREISLGLIKIGDVRWVLAKELAAAVVIGLVLGVVLFVFVRVTQGQVELGLVIGGAVPIIMLFATAVGGTTPLVLRAMGMDPAMASGPLVQALIDLTSFFTVLMLATAAMAWLVP